jgi:hypothetical protein
MNAITISTGRTPSRSALIKSLHSDVTTALDHSSAVTAVEALQRAEATLTVLFPGTKPTKAKRTILPLVRELRRNAAERDKLQTDRLLAEGSPEQAEYSRVMGREESLLAAVMLAKPATLAEAAHQLDAALDCVGTATEDGLMPRQLHEDIEPALLALGAVRDFVMRACGLTVDQLWSSCGTELAERKPADK